MRKQHPSSRVQAQPNVVLQHGLDKLLGRLLVVGDVLEGRVHGHKQRVVGRGAVEQLHDILVLVDQLGELGRVLTLADELVDGLVGLAVVAARPVEGVDAEVRVVNHVAEDGVADVLHDVFDVEGGGAEDVVDRVGE